MSKRKWTREPWEHGHKTLCGAPWFGVYAGGVIVAHLLSTVGEFNEESANAERMVACVNACRGIDDPEAAIKAAREALDRVEGVLEENWRNKGIGEKYEALTDVRTALALLGEGAE